MKNNLTYSEATDGLNNIISSLGFPLFMGEAEAKPTVKVLRAKVSAYYTSLNKNNRLDVLHAYDAESKTELIENALTQMLERVEA
jgi:hypothetical protein